MKMNLQALALMSAALVMPTTARMPGTNGGSDPRDNWAPVSDSAALAAARREAEASRKAKHAAKLARRAAQKEKGRKLPSP